MLSGELIRKLHRLRLAPVRPTIGPQRGDLRSPRQGVGTEFHDYRAYHPGDDERTIDWHVAARTDQLVVRLHEGEDNVRVDLLVDQSLSMQYGDPTKLHFARSVAAALGYIALQSGHQVRAATFSEGLSNRSAPLHGTAGSVELLRFLREGKATGGTSLYESLRRHSLEQPLPGLTFILSDLYDPNGWQDGVNALLATGRIVYLCHVLTPEEIQPDREGAFELVDAETAQRSDIALDHNTIDLYQTTFAQWTSEIRSFCAKRGVRYIRMQTETPLEDLILITLRQEGIIK